MKKLLTTLVLVMLLVCAFCMVSYAANNFEVTYTAQSNGQVATVPLETFPQVIYQLNNAKAVEGKFYVKLLNDASDGYVSGKSSTITKNSAAGFTPTVEIDLNGKTLSTTTQYTIDSAGTNVTIKNGNINHTVKGSYPFLVQSNASLTTNNVNIVSEGNGLSGNWHQSGRVGGHLTLYNTNITAKGNVVLYTMCPESNVEVYGGTFVVTGENAVNNGADDIGRKGSVFKFQNAASVEIYGGTYSNTYAQPTTFNKLNGEQTGNNRIKIYGGTYPISIPENVIASGYENVANDNGTYTVSKKPLDVTNGANVNYDNGNGEYTYRFFSAVDNYENYASVVFEITSNDYTWEIELYEVYEKVTVNGESYAAEGYVVTGAIGDVPNDDVEFAVNAYAVDFEGNKIPLN